MPSTNKYVHISYALCIVYFNALFTALIDGAVNVFSIAIREAAGGGAAVKDRECAVGGDE